MQSKFVAFFGMRFNQAARHGFPDRICAALLRSGLVFLLLAAAATAQTVTLSPASLNFGNVVVGSTSTAKNVILTNTGGAGLSIGGVTVAAPFAQTNTCGSTVLAHQKCTISVTFAPLATGTANGTVTITDNASNSPQTVSISGVGVAAVTLSPATLTFASRTVGSTSNPISVTLLNNLSTTLSITSVAVSGDFAQTNTCGSSVAGKAKCTISVTFTPTVVGPRTGTLTVVDSAGNSPQTANLSGTGSMAGLISIAVTPANPSVAVGATEQFTATGTFSGGETYNVTQSVTWSSSTASVAAISNASGTQGLASALAAGTSTIKATSGKITGSTLLTVTSAPSLVSIAVTPTAPSIALGSQQQFTATGTYSDGSTQNLTNSVSWTSSAPAVATINSTGFTTSAATGTTTITASSGSISGGTTLTVTTTALVFISVTPASTLVTIGNTVSLSATGTYSDGSTQNLTSSATWNTSNASVASVTAGVVTGVSDGSATITASQGAITSAAATTNVGTAADFFVALNGNDSWSGTLFMPNSTGTDGPFATIARAQSAVQTLLANSEGRTAPVTVLIRAGTYYQQALTFSSADSGTASLQVIWENYPNEAPVLSGGMLVTGWTNTGGNSYQATLPVSTQYFENLFYSGQRRLRPRLGGGTLGSYYRILATVYLSGSPPPAAPPEPNCSLYVTGKGWECFDRFTFNPGDLTTWKNLNPPYPQGDIELVDFEWWTAPRLRIQSVDTTNNIVYMTGPTSMAITHGFIATHRYLVENVKDAFTQAGQWFLDRSVTPWTLTYLANTGENPLGDTVVIPQAAQVLIATNLSYVTFEGLTFQNDNFVVPAAGYVSLQQEPQMPAAVACFSCQYVVFDSDVITQTSGSGIDFRSTAPTAATTTSNAFQNGAIYDIGGMGLRIGSPPATTDTDANVAQFNTVQNTLIQGIARVFPASVGLVQGSGHDNTYTHNDIFDGYHSGIEVGLPQTGRGKTNSNGSFNNIASFNHIFDLFEGVTDDGGALYFATGGPTFSPTGNQILNNKIHDTSDASVIDSDGYGGNGIYLDGSTGLVNVQNNLLYRISGMGTKFTDGPQQPNEANTVQNNIIAYSRTTILGNTNPYSPNNVCPTVPVTVFNASNNLFYFDRNETSNFYVQQGCEYSCGFPITSMHNWQSNLYWRLDGAFAADTEAFHVEPNPAPKLCGGSGSWTFYTFSGWQGLGEDAASVANQNPGFNNPAYPNDDYSLPNGSPGVGFVVFDPTQAGRSSPIINPTDVNNIPATFPTNFFSPYTDY